MTVSSTTSRVSYSGNGSTKAFAVNFYFLADSHLKVVLRAADGTETVKTLTTDYTVSGAGNPAGGTVTMVVAPASGQTLVIVRNVPLTQETDYQANDPFPAESHERALDKLTMEMQQVQEEIDRCAKLPVTDPASADALVADLIRLADSADNLDIVANNIDDVNTVAADIADVNTVAGNIASVNTVAGISVDVTTVAGNTANINAVNANKANIDINAANIVDIQNAEENAQIVLSALNEVTDGVRDRFVGGVDYTKNSTTQLTLSNTPLKGETVKVFFSGVYQEKTTWSRSGAVITFTSAIPVDSVEVTYDIGRSFAELDTAVATATTKASEASASAATANTKAGEAAGSAASALAIYGSAAAQQSAVSTAQAQASLAAGYAASASSVVQQDLSAITAQALHRSPNAVTAMFVYDTSKDSDGGAWTEKCQHTSWYNETLNGKWLGAQASESAARAVSGATTGDYFQLTTDGKFYKLNATSGTTEVFRGNKAKFPKLAGIVAEASNVTIYDLTEPGRPMWMRFVWSGALSMLSNNNPGKSLAAMNGRVLVGDAQYDLLEFDFTKDFGYRYSLNNVTGPYKGNLAARNAYLGWIQNGTLNIANRAVNAVAMTVLPDAPVDPVTGLQVPTIAVATAGGVSVIKHNGTVVNSSSTSAYTKVILDEKEVGAVYASGFAVASNPGALGSSFSLTNYTTSAAPALMGAPTVVA